MVDLRAGRNVGFLELDEIAYFRVLGEARSRTNARERADARIPSDQRTLDMAEGMNRRSVGHFDASPEDDMWLDRDVAPQLRVESEPDAFRIDQGRTLRQR